MADITKFSIVTYERRPGHWRAAITPIRKSGAVISAKTISSIVTPDDSASESDAKFAVPRRCFRKPSCVMLRRNALWFTDFRPGRPAKHLLIKNDAFSQYLNGPFSRHSSRERSPSLNRF
jgi:hypothetical protein